MKPYPIREEHEPVKYPTWGLMPIAVFASLLGGTVADRGTDAFLVATAMTLVIGGVWALGVWVTNRRRRAGHAYRQATDPVIDESLGTWTVERMRDRDNRRGKGHWKGK